jgi:hypothetical protein
LLTLFQVENYNIENKTTCQTIGRFGGEMKIFILKVPACEFQEFPLHKLLFLASAIDLKIGCLSKGRCIAAHRYCRLIMRPYQYCVQMGTKAAASNSTGLPMAMVESLVILTGRR